MEDAFVVGEIGNLPMYVVILDLKMAKQKWTFEKTMENTL
jgi:hypothetical protein